MCHLGPLPGRMWTSGSKDIPVIGLCFLCGEMGHLRQSCSKNLLPYPLSIDDYMHMYTCEVSIPYTGSSGINCGNDDI